MNSVANPKATTTVDWNDEAIFHEAAHFLATCALWFQAHTYRNYQFQEVPAQVYNWLCDANLAARADFRIRTDDVRLVIRRPRFAGFGNAFGKMRNSLRAIPLPPLPTSVKNQDDDAAGSWLYETFRPRKTGWGNADEDW